jgi:isoleucyl-tRNA synthetase
MSDRVDFWLDMENPYNTYVKQLHRIGSGWSRQASGRKGPSVQGPQGGALLPRCGTALVSHEVSQGYKEVEDNTASCASA